MHCDIVEDLLPLYAEDICSQASRAAVEAHVACCERCRQKLDLLRSGAPEPASAETESAGALKKVKKAVFKNMLLWWACITMLAVCTAAMCFAAFHYEHSVEEVYGVIMMFMLPFTAFGLSALAGLSDKKYAIALPLLLAVPVVLFGRWWEFAAPLGVLLLILGFVLGKCWFGRLPRRQKTEKLKKQIAAVCLVLAAANLALAGAGCIRPFSVFGVSFHVLQIDLCFPCLVYAFSFLCTFTAEERAQRYLRGFGSAALAAGVFLAYYACVSRRIGFTGAFDWFLPVYALLPALFGAVTGAFAHRKGEVAQDASL